jgi:CRP-like cAMP-binding protein
MENLKRIVMAHPFFTGFEAELGDLITGCARNLRFEPGQYLFRSGEAANEFYLIRHGTVALEIQPPGKPPIITATEGEGDIVGTSWLVPPYRWSFDARATTLVRAISLDATCLRAKCEADHHLGYALMKRFLPEISQRLDATRLQMLDVYGTAKK